MSTSSVHADPPPPIVSEPSTGINYATSIQLGKGGFAICFKGERYNGSRPTGQIVALKIVKTKMEPAKLAQKVRLGLHPLYIAFCADVQQFVTELQIHSKLSHPNIVTFYRAFSFSASTYVVLELCPNGSLADMLKKRRFLTLPEIRRLVIQVCGAVKYLHHRHIVHRDLKTGNLFLDDKMNVKVGDFGLAALLVSGREMEHTRRTTMCGTPNYLAPEILEKGKGHDEKVDLWAIGVIAYTLAVGKAPFHASTKDEIYKKLKSGEYEWPGLTSTANQSFDLRDLVSSLLVPEEQRPSPDKIVSHPFFRIAFVPSTIPTTAREIAPAWPEVTLPSAEVIQRGYSDTWFEVCKESGVGEYEGGCFPLNGGRKVKSIVHDITRECQAGTQPVMPLPQDVVYTSAINSIDSPLGPSAAPHETTRAIVKGSLKEMSHNEVSTTRPRVTAAPSAAKDADLMPPPPRTTSRLGRTGTMRRAARTISEEAASSSESVKVKMDSSSGQSETLRIAKTRSTPTTALKDTNLPTLATLPSARSQHNLCDFPPSTGEPKRSADASLARRPRGTRTIREGRPPPSEVPGPAAHTSSRTKGRPQSPGPLATLDELKQVSPFKYRKKVPTPEVIEILSDHETDSRQQAAAALPTLIQNPLERTARQYPLSQRKASVEIDAAVSGTDPDTVLQKLSTLRDNLASALARNPKQPSNSRTSPPNDMETAALPFVSRWVDYSRKHGVGYVLADGTVGCIINASRKPGRAPTPVTHVLVRNGQRWLQHVGKTKDFAGIEQIPLQVFEDRDARGGIQRKVYPGLDSVREGPLLLEAERRRTLSILWVKFGRYMCQSLEGEESLRDAAAGGDDPDFVRFYQRIGNVGVWAFTDGCLQVHFPDHTKLVLSASGLTLSATLLSSTAVEYLAQKSDLLPQHVSSRQVVAGATRALLFDGPRAQRQVVRANQVAEKLTFVLLVVGQWVRNGGLGRLDEDEQKGGKLLWDGLGVHDGTRKTDIVTVGRFGGDGAMDAVEHA